MLPFRGINGSWSIFEDNQGRRTLVAAIRDDEIPNASAIEYVVSGWHAGRPDIEAMTVRGAKGDVSVPLARHVDWMASMRDVLDLDAGQAGPAPRALTDDFLAAVLATYDDAPKGQRVEAVQAAYGGSRGSVYRWLAAARERAEHS
jgi:hypothetical protein